MLIRYLYGSVLFVVAATFEHIGRPMESLVFAVVAVYVLGSLLKEVVCGN